MKFASEHGIDSVLVEGWNEGWSTYPGDGTGFRMGVDDSYPDFDVGTVTDYGAGLSDPSRVDSPSRKPDRPLPY